ncbi:MAG: CheY-P-specific phosphatase CheC [Alkaliphilus sp.]|nr:MAG: CheY-P-specific phosphatase CheC [Alkaliphilus sp.]
MSASKNEIKDIHMDVLREIGNIGAGNAATSLSKLMQRKIDMSVPSVQILELNEVSAALGGEENIVAGIYFQISGDINGFIMLLLDIQSSKTLTNILMMREDSSNELDEMDKSALQEVGNILSGAYVSSLSSLTNLSINISVPSLCIDMAGAILSVPAIYFSHISDKILLINTAMNEHSDKSVNANFLLIPDFDSFKTLMNSLGVAL